jgi:hypothetical protein
VRRGNKPGGIAREARASRRRQIRATASRTQQRRAAPARHGSELRQTVGFLLIGRCIHLAAGVPD